ncbi:MAG TPA: tyrosine--tRNA ligase [Acidimicrobiales bacterium]|nr:tyrosine--tRNA ligase [Acidimicrobiales bacterium]
MADLEARGLLQDSTDREQLRARLADGPITLYYGCDPTDDSLQMGNLIGLLVLRRFADAGHRPIALAGGATGMIGDPGGKSEERNLLDADSLATNLAGIKRQIARIVGEDVPLVDNGTWTNELPLLAFLRDVGKHVTVNHMVAKESVKTRMASEHGISYTEFSYMLLQANDYHWLHVNEGCDLQIGGSDQWGNIVLGVDLIRRRTGDHVHAFSWPLLLRADGQKFGKSAGGETLWLDPARTSPYELFQYWMRVPDADVRRFLLQLTLLSVEEANAVADAHDQAPERREGQRRLARENVTIVHGAAAAAAAEGASALLFGGDPYQAGPDALALLAAEVPTVVGDPVGRLLVDLLAESGTVKSKSEARRLGSVAVNGASRPVEDPVVADDLLHDRWVVLRKGKSSYVLLDREK